MENDGRNPAKVKIINMYFSSFVHQATHFMIEGYQSGLSDRISPSEIHAGNFQPLPVLEVVSRIISSFTFIGTEMRLTTL